MTSVCRVTTTACRSPRGAARMAMALVCLAHAGCAVTDIDSTYGQRSGYGAKSVNGVGVFSAMIAEAGHRVLSARRLTPTLAERADVIVWFPDATYSPNEETRRWFDDWLAAEPNRVLIFVMNDFDAAAGYWAAVAPGAPPPIAAEIVDRQKRAEAMFLGSRDDSTDIQRRGWFRYKGKRNFRQVRTLSGDPEWLAGVDPAKLGIELNGRVLPRAHSTSVLMSERDTLVSREEVGESHRYIVANGSFLLNLPLVNHEHRKLAGKFIDALGEAPRRVYFIQTYGDPEIYKVQPPPEPPDSLRILRVPPFNHIFLQLAAAGLIFCFARLPIFGRARGWITENLSDFGQHVTALGSLLSRTRDKGYAEAQLHRYRESPRRAAGARPVRPGLTARRTMAWKNPAEPPPAGESAPPEPPTSTNPTSDA